MEALISPLHLQQILERGLVGGLWSIDQFNRGIRPITLPRPGFLTENPQFMDKSFRDMEAFFKAGHKTWL